MNDETDKKDAVDASGGYTESDLNLMQTAGESYQQSLANSALKINLTVKNELLEIKRKIRKAIESGEMKCHLDSISKPASDYLVFKGYGITAVFKNTNYGYPYADGYDVTWGEAY